MSRATIVLLIILIAIIVGLIFLSRRQADVPVHHIEQTVTLNSTDGAQG